MEGSWEMPRGSGPDRRAREERPDGSGLERSARPVSGLGDTPRGAEGGLRCLEKHREPPGARSKSSAKAKAKGSGQSLDTRHQAADANTTLPRSHSTQTPTVHAELVLGCGEQTTGTDKMPTRGGLAKYLRRGLPELTRTAVTRPLHPRASRGSLTTLDHQ